MKLLRELKVVHKLFIVVVALFLLWLLNKRQGDCRNNARFAHLHLAKLSVPEGSQGLASSKQNAIGRQLHREETGQVNWIASEIFVATLIYAVFHSHVCVLAFVLHYRLCTSALQFEFENLYCLACSCAFTKSSGCLWLLNLQWAKIISLSYLLKISPEGLIK